MKKNGIIYYPKYLYTNIFTWMLFCAINKTVFFHIFQTVKGKAKIQSQYSDKLLDWSFAFLAFKFLAWNSSVKVPKHGIDFKETFVFK